MHDINGRNGSGHFFSKSEKGIITKQWVGVEPCPLVPQAGMITTNVEEEQVRKYL